MAKSYSVAEARAHLPELLEHVEAGKEIELTRRGRPVAVVLSAQRYEDLLQKRIDFGEGYRAFLTRYDLREIGLDAGFLDGLR